MRILDEQIKQHGRCVKAVTEAILICSDRNILKKYLETKRKDVINIMMMLLDQETALEMHIKNREQDVSFRTAVEFSKLYGKSLAETIDALAKKFNLSKTRSTDLVNEYWND